MLQWLNDWLKSIILIILLAAFVDLILPNRSMQRYVKVVISLFILITLLNPVVQLLKADFQLEKIDFPSSPADRLLPSYASLPDIMEEGEELGRTVQKQSADLVRTRMQEMMENQVEEELGLEVARISAVLDKAGENSLVLKEVTVVLGREGGEDGKTAEAGADRERKRSGIAEMQPVSVQVQVGEANGAKPDVAGADGANRSETVPVAPGYTAGRDPSVDRKMGFARRPDQRASGGKGVARRGR